MDLLGPNIENLFNFCYRKLSKLHSFWLIKCYQNRIYSFKSFIHRDIKPDNSLIGIGPNKSSIVYAIGFGLAKKYRDPRTLMTWV